MRETGGHRPEEFKELQDALVNTESVEQFLHDMAVLAARLIGADLSCGMTMRSNGRPVTVACSESSRGGLPTTASGPAWRCP
jgi:hypothetical protein